MERVNVIVGRFQPLTLGHIKGAEEVWKKYSLKTVFCIVDTPESKLNDKHPFPSDLIIYNNDIKEEWFGGFAPVMNADIGKIAKACRGIDFEPVLWTCGTDRVKSYEKQCIEKYIEMYDLDPSIRVNEIKRTDDDISASKVRECIKQDDFKGYCDLMPKWSWKKFEEYKGYIQIKENNIFKGMRNISDFINEAKIYEAKVVIDPDKDPSTFTDDEKLYVIKQFVKMLKSGDIESGWKPSEFRSTKKEFRSDLNSEFARIHENHIKQILTTEVTKVESAYIVVDENNHSYNGSEFMYTNLPKSIKNSKVVKKETYDSYGSLGIKWLMQVKYDPIVAAANNELNWFKSKEDAMGQFNN